MPSRLAAVAALTGAALVVAPLSAEAFFVEDCSTKNSLCYVTTPLTIPVGTPPLGSVGFGRSAFEGPELCNTGTGQCQQTWVLLPGAVVSVSGTTLASVTIPSFGFRAGASGQAVYYGVPSVDADGTLDGAVGATVEVPIVPVVTDGSECPNAVPDPGLRTVTYSGCYVTVAVEVL